MIVYLETALLENFLIDGLLLWVAAKCARGKISYIRLLLSSAIGAAFAVAFPLIALPDWAAYLVKLLSGILIAVLAAPKGVKKAVLTAAAFLFFTFAFGGLLTAAYSFFGVEYAEGSGYLVESAPIALVLCAAIVFVLVAFAAIKAFFKFRNLQKNILVCRLKAQHGEVKWRGLADSGNRLTYCGNPVSVVSAAGIFALFGSKPQAVGRMRIDTVNGSREAPVFLLEKIVLCGREIFGVYLTVGSVSGKEYQIILHTALTEECHESSQHLTKVAQRGEGRRKRRSLSLRK